ncbi:cysteine hydrolase family protein [Oceanobacillus sp. Castelsardo]|uniref:cysteine hydrolase family protein n=1 Tax=Oceanobacillus sp. Castelsardo TaxID=1851204 RepID=UPI0009EEB023|nr:isochorismatase family cysteine hydrolase [Oceanobacillus sp. Castelsardo]
MDLAKTALLLIDLQKEEGTSEIEDMDGILDRASNLIEECREKGVPIIYTRHINRADAVGLAAGEPLDENGEPIYYHSHSSSIEIADEIKPEQGDIIIDKYRYSGFYESNLELVLKNLHIKHLIIGGVLTDCCVMSTVMDAYYRDYQVNLVRDICGTTSEGAHMASVLMMANWIYNLQIYDADQIRKKLNDETYEVWETDEPDELPFTPENLRKQFSKL